MRKSEVRVIEKLRSGPLTVTELSEAIKRNQGWTSELVADLEEDNLVKKDDKVELVESHETQLLTELMGRYDLTEVLTGKKEEILVALTEDSKTVSELELDGFAKSTLYKALKELRTRGAVTKSEDGEYSISDDTLGEFVDIRSRSIGGEYTAEDAKIVTNRDEGQPTAFSAFQRYGVDYHPKDEFRYVGEEDTGIEEVLMHAVRVAETKKQTAMCAVFFLRHRASLESDQLWKLANRWDCVEKWADIQALLDQREIQQDELFLPWDEFTDLARDYNVYPRGKHPENSLLTGLTDVGERLDQEVDTYLLGGGNLILRDLKDSTKDIDVVVKDERELASLVDALKRLGYEERRDLSEVYEQMNPSIVLERDGFPRWDIFVEVVADNLYLTKGMTERADQSKQFGNLAVHLLSLIDIFLFKAITDREGDLEDNALIARQSDLNWQAMVDEIQRQEEVTDRLFSFSVLDTLDLLEESNEIQTPIHDKLVSYCLENALLLSFEEPKTIRDLRDELDFPDHQIYNKLRSLEDSGEIEVDRSGKLNRYSAAK